MADLRDRLAGAPISWGVCEVPGWGAMLPPDRVLGDMRSLGLRATELGALGWLGDGPEQVRATLERNEMRAIAGFVPISLHEPSLHAQAERDATAAAELLQAAGAGCFVTALVVDEAWSPPFELDELQWQAVSDGLARVDAVCAAHGLRQVLHPHVGTLVESAGDVAETLARADVAWCLDTGHLAIGGVDPTQFAAEHADSVGLVHLKDVDLDLARAVRAHELGLQEATRRGLFRPLGHGGVDVAGTVQELEKGGYRGWYVFEQDIAIDVGDVGGARPELDVLASIRFVEELAGS